MRVCERIEIEHEGNLSMEMCKIVLLSFFLFFMVSCNEYDKIMDPVFKAKLSQKDSNQIIDGEVDPPIPDRSENDKTILGIDNNKNGIRDDVDIWINQTALNYNERMGMRQFARAHQERLRACKEKNKNEIPKVESEVGHADSCLGAVSDYQRGGETMSHMILKIIMNTNLRRECPKYFDQYNYSFGGNGALSGSPHMNCKFVIKNVEEVIKEYRKFWKYAE